MKKHSFMTKKIDGSRSPVIFPKALVFLKLLGENIKLAYKRRGYSQLILSERTGLSRLTIRKIERGDPTVSIGHYVSVLHSLDLSKDLGLVAKDDELGRKLQDIKLLKKSPR
jgi:transcriptional regulator with XRE-family HTH domain